MKIKSDDVETRTSQAAMSRIKMLHICTANYTDLGYARANRTEQKATLSLPGLEPTADHMLDFLMFVSWKVPLEFLPFRLVYSQTLGVGTSLLN